MCCRRKKKKKKFLLQHRFWNQFMFVDTPSRVSINETKYAPLTFKLDASC